MKIKYTQNLKEERKSYVDGMLVDDAEDSRVLAYVTLEMARRLRRRAPAGCLH